MLFLFGSDCLLLGSLSISITTCLLLTFILLMKYSFIAFLGETVQRNIKTEFSKFEKYKDVIPHGGCVL